MIEQAIKSIVEAEDKASQIISQAQKRAVEIKSETTAVVEDIQDKSLKEIKEFKAQALAHANEVASGIEKEVYFAEKALADEKVERYKMNLNKAVEYCLKQLEK